METKENNLQYVLQKRSFGIPEADTCLKKDRTNSKTPIKGPSNYMSLLVNRATMQGMLVFDYADQYPKAVEDIYKWIEMGKIKSSDTIVEGIDNFYDAFLRLFSVEKQGKLLLKVA